VIERTGGLGNMHRENIQAAGVQHYLEPSNYQKDEQNSSSTCGM